MNESKDELPETAKPPTKGLLRCFSTMLYSIKGLKAAWKYEESFRQEVGIFIITTPLALYFGQNLTEQILMIGSVVLLLIVELLNSAVETVVDRVSTEKHELSGRAKDLGSAAVMLVILGTIAVWASILLSH
jgi:diacylglycerol kinase (ATP)